MATKILSPAEVEDIALECIKNNMLVRNVKHVILVDDVLEFKTDLEELRGWLKGQITEEQKQKIHEKIPALEITELPIENVLGNLNTEWDNRNEEERYTIKNQVAKALGLPPDKEVARDFNVTKKLNIVFKDLGTSFLKPNDWNHEKIKEVSVNLQDGEFILCLFDQDLSKANGFTSTGTKSGIGLVKELLSINFPNVICGIISHTYTIGQELTEWNAFAKEQGIPPSGFLLLAKERINKYPDLAEGLKSITMNQTSEKIKKELLSVMSEAVKETEKILGALDVHNFDHIVVKSSHKEGISELQTLSRVYGIINRNEANRILNTGTSGQRINDLIKQLREISELNTGKGETIPDPTFRNYLRHIELFEDSEMINPSFSPIKLGDIFKIGEREFILLAQPCELMVREDGVRIVDEEEFDLIGPLIELNTDLVSLANFTKKERQTGKGFLQYIDSNSDAGKVVEFDHGIYIDVNVLDLAVFNSDGECKLDLNANPIVPPQLHSPWQKRHKILVEKYTNLKGELEELIPEIGNVPEKLKDRTWEGLIPHISIPKIVETKTVFQDGFFNFGIKRLMRYKEPEASRILKSYLEYKGRDAREFDYAPELKKFSKEV